MQKKWHAQFTMCVSHEHVPKSQFTMCVCHFLCISLLRCEGDIVNYDFEHARHENQRRQWHPTPELLSGKISWMEEPGRLQSMGSQRVGHNWATSVSLFTFMHGEGNGNPLQCPCLENPRDGGAWWAAIYGITQSRTRLKWLSSSKCAEHYQIVYFKTITLMCKETCICMFHWIL